jgi:hypothetical protein
MNKSKLKSFFSLPLIVAFFCANGQADKITPLHTFFQNNFDSTIIWTPSSNWQLGHNYFIVTKKDTSIYFFAYLMPYRNINWRDYPRVLGEKFADENDRFSLILPDTNLYFNPIPVDYSLKKKYWGEVNANDIWSVPDSGSREHYTIDGSQDNFFLIANGKIRKSIFYWLHDNKWIDIDINRKKAHLTEEVFRKIFY